MEHFYFAFYNISFIVQFLVLSSRALLLIFYSNNQTNNFLKFSQVHKSYQGGTYRYGPLHQVSIVGTVHEEVGGYFPKMVSIMERSPFLNLVMPWGPMSSVKMASPTESNDGPILWVRPGEQLIPTACLSTSSTSKSRVQNELRGLLRRASEPRELMFEDRYVNLLSTELCLAVVPFRKSCTDAPLSFATSRLSCSDVVAKLAQ